MKIKLQNIYQRTLEEVNNELIFEDGTPISTWDNYTLCGFSQSDAHLIWEVFLYDIWGSPDIKFHSFGIIEDAARINSLDDAVKLLQRTIGNDDGMNAGQFFTDVEGNSELSANELWESFDFKTRVRILVRYLEYELECAHLYNRNIAPFKFLKTL